MRKLTALVLMVSLFSCTNHNHSSNNGTAYLRTVFWTSPYGGSLDISWVYLGNDGTIVKDPRHGLDPVDIEAEKKDNGDNAGTYKEDGDKLKITWSNGKTDDWSIEKKNDDYVAMDGGLVSIPEKFADGEHIKGQFAAAAFSPSFSNVQTMVFDKDGKFTLVNSVAVSNQVVSAYNENSKKGTYQLNGNTIHLNFDDGTKYVASIAHWKDADGKLTLVINNNSFPQED